MIPPFFYFREFCHELKGSRKKYVPIIGFACSIALIAMETICKKITVRFSYRSITNMLIKFGKTRMYKVVGEVREILKKAFYVN